MSRIERLADDILVLSDLVPVDGRVSWVPAAARGFEPYNEYVVLADDHVLLIDTGVAVHGPSILATLKEIVGSRRLTIWATRIELDCLGNLGMLIDHFPQAQVATANVISPPTLVHFAPETPPPLPVKHLRMGDGLASIGFPRLRSFDPVMRTLGTSWLWDEPSKTLFTTDFFCTDMLPSESDPVIRRDNGPVDSVEYVRDGVVRKFDWLHKVDTDNLLARWDSFFGSIEPTAIAPIHGRVQFGRERVQQTIARYREAVFFRQDVAEPREMALS
jgi:flavorubredoxin